MPDGIYVKGAREHNLKSINVFIPRNQITVVTGVSGSGKSSLVFDTIYAEGQKRYIETLSAYSRYFMDKLKPPDVDSIFGLSPVAAIDQKTISYNPRSTIGTVTEVYDYLRLLFAKVGRPVCPAHLKPLKQTSLEDIYKKVFHQCFGRRISILAPVIRGKKGFMTAEMEKYMKLGFVKAYIDGQAAALTQPVKLEKRKSHHIALVIDQIDVSRKYSSRFKEALRLADSLADGFITIQQKSKSILYSTHSSCPVCFFSAPELDPKLFSFNSPKGACIQCNGVGRVEENLSEEVCSKCKGRRLKPSALSVYINGKNIFQMCQMDLEELSGFLKKLKFSKKEELISKSIIQKILDHLDVLKKTGVSYLSLNRSTQSLSGGEAQRVRLAGQIGSALIGVLYIFDEPSIGLHPADHQQLLQLIQEIKKRQNTILMVEHDEETIRQADSIIDVGPGAGRLGGQLVFQGSVSAVLKNKKSITGDYLSKRKVIEIPQKRRKGKEFLELIGACGNNLKNVHFKIPLGVFNCVTGVSGSGKSSLIMDTLYKGLSSHLGRSDNCSLPYEKSAGFGLVDKVIVVDQKPIGRTSRSVPATYVGVMSFIRSFMALLPESKVQGCGASHFSFNVSGGRCEYCEGAGQIRQEMHFLSDVVIPCEACQGQRYSMDILNIKYKEKNISDILNMTVREALEFFENHPLIVRHLKTLDKVGLSYLTLGQSSVSLSGGEAQRIKLTKELSKKYTKKTLYILDEPTTGLHFDDIKKLLAVLNHLVDKGNTVIVIEHNMDVIKSSDYIVDLGPGGGRHGGKILAQGAPEKVSQVNRSLTGQYLSKILN